MIVMMSSSLSRRLRRAKGAIQRALSSRELDFVYEYEIIANGAACRLCGAKDYQFLFVHNVNVIAC